MHVWERPDAPSGLLSPFSSRPRLERGLTKDFVVKVVCRIPFYPFTVVGDSSCDLLGQFSSDSPQFAVSELSSFMSSLYIILLYTVILIHQLFSDNRP